MSMFETIGLLAIILVVIAAGAAIWFVTTIRKAMKLAGTVAPCRVNPEPEPNPRWRSGRKVRSFADEYRALGFQEVGAFSIPEMNGLQMLGFIHPDERLYGAIYDHEAIGPTFDICCNFQDGTSLTATNTAMGDTLDERPGHRTLWLGVNRVDEVLDAFRREAPSTPREPVSSEGFVPYFKNEYAKGMNWRLKKGGVTREEIRRQAEKDGQSLSDEQLEEAYESLRATYLEQIREGCIAQYLDENAMTAEEWEQRQWNVFVITETMDATEVLDAIDAMVGLDEEQRHRIENLPEEFGETGVDRGRKILANHAAALGLKEIGEVSEPVPALIVEAPAPAGSEKFDA